MIYCIKARTGTVRSTKLDVWLCFVESGKLASRTEIESIANFVCCMMDPEHSCLPPRLPLCAILPSLILTLFAIQYITVMMQSDHDGEEPTEADHTTPSVAGGKAQWNSVEVSAFVDYLHEHHAE